MRLLICAGGSGGGVYPALSILQAAQDAKLVTDLLWVGAQGGMETELVQREGIAFQAVPAAPVHGLGWRTPFNLMKLILGVWQARTVLRKFRPDVLLFTGGYVAIPVALAGRRIPALLYVPDIEPGLALKTLARFAARIALIANESRKYFTNSKILTTTGHPVRQGLTAWNREQALQEFDLNPEIPTLLIFGGSKGARSINYAVLDLLPKLLPELQVLHISGELDWPKVTEAQESLAPELAKNYRAYPYLHEEMGAAYTAADLIVSRAGASSVGEFPLFGVPAILVPYPHAWRYQKVNADYLVENGAAVLLEDQNLTAKLFDTIKGLMHNQTKRDSMGQAMKSLAHPEAAQTLARHLSELASQS